MRHGSLHDSRRRGNGAIVKSPRILQIATALAVATGAAVIGGTAPVATVSASTELSSFETSPGIVRTSLALEAVDADADTGLLYGVGIGTGDAVDDERRLFAVDPGPSEAEPITPFNTVQVVDDVVLEAGLRPSAVDVSRDGRTVVVGSRDRAVVYERSSLDRLAVVDVPADGVVASPDQPGRFLASDGVGRTVNAVHVPDEEPCLVSKDSRPLLDLDQSVSLIHLVHDDRDDLGELLIAVRRSRLARRRKADGEHVFLG